MQARNHALIGITGDAPGQAYLPNLRGCLVIPFVILSPPEAGEVSGDPSPPLRLRTKHPLIFRLAAQEGFSQEQVGVLSHQTGLAVASGSGYSSPSKPLLLNQIIIYILLQNIHQKKSKDVCGCQPMERIYKFFDSYRNFKL